MFLWLDDERPPPDETWTWIDDPLAAIDLLERGVVEIASLDHDLGVVDADGRDIDGHYVLRALAEAVHFHGITPPADVRVHSANPVGAARMRETLRRDILPASRGT